MSINVNWDDIRSIESGASIVRTWIVEGLTMTKDDIAKLWINATDELRVAEGVDDRGEALEAWRIKWVGTRGSIRRAAIDTLGLEVGAYAREVYHAALRAFNDALERLRGVSLSQADHV